MIMIYLMFGKCKGEEDKPFIHVFLFVCLLKPKVKESETGGEQVLKTCIRLFLVTPQ